MKLEVEFLSLPLITRGLGRKKISVAFPGGNLSQLLKHLSGSVKKFREMVLDGGEVLASDVQLYVNGTSRVSGETIHETELKDGDQITFMMLVAGG
jgi:molybdopterin converting factor small subunit